MNDFLTNEYVVTTYEAMLYLLCSFVLFFIGKLGYQLVHPKIKIQHELVVQDNLAFSFAYVGYFIGIISVVGSVLIGPSKGILFDVMDIMVYGIVSIVLLNISTKINDTMLLSTFSVHKEIVEDQNSGTGIVEGASSIASGLILFGALLGESHSIGFGILTAVIFWAIGQCVLILTAKLYNLMTPYNIHEHIEKDNVAVGVGFAGALIAIGNLIRFALIEEFTSWSASLLHIGILIVVGFLLLPILRFLTDKVLLPGQKLTDEIINQEKPNIGVSLIEAFAYIAGSVLLTWCL